MKNKFETELMALVKSGGTHVKEVEEELNATKEEFNRNAMSLIGELRKIKDWDVMIQRMYSWFISAPDRFFDDCKVDFGNDALRVWMNGPYTDDYPFLVLSINVHKSLQEQVDEAMKEMTECFDKYAEKEQDND